MLVMENDTAVLQVCSQCGGPVVPGQPYILRDDRPIHSQSDDCDASEGWNPHMDSE
jgi:hypothetical protein